MMVNSNNGDDDAPEVESLETLWTEKLESYFVSLMVDKIVKGTMQATTFANAAWVGIAESLKKRSGKKYTYYQLKNKYHNLRARWSDFSSLLSEKNIQYDSFSGEVTATDDVWRRLYTKYRRAKSFRKKGFKDYDKLCVIFGRPEIQSCNEDVGNMDNVYDDFTKGDGGSSSVKRSERPHGFKVSPKVTMGDGSRKKQKLEKMSNTASLDSVADTGDGYGHQTTHFQDVVSCMKALNALEGLSGALYSKATRFIHDDPLWRKMFLCMPDERKKDWMIHI